MYVCMILISCNLWFQCFSPHFCFFEFTQVTCVCAVSCYSIFPLLFEAQEYPVKVLLLLLHSILMWSGFSGQFYNGAETRAVTDQTEKKDDHIGRNGNSGASVKKGGFVIGWIESIYLLGLVVVEIWGQFLHPILLGDKLAFAPLMLISVYCAFGIMYSWIWQLRSIVKSP